MAAMYKDKMRSKGSGCLMCNASYQNMLPRVIITTVSLGKCMHILPVAYTQSSLHSQGVIMLVALYSCSNYNAI